MFSQLAKWSRCVMVSSYLRSFSQSKYFRGEKRTSKGNDSLKEKNIMPLSFVFLAYRICPLVLKLQKAIESGTHCNRVNTKTTGAGPSIEFIGGILFLPGHENIIEVMMLIRITGERVKFIGIKSIKESFINTSLHTLNRFTLHNSDNTSLQFVYFDQSTPSLCTDLPPPPLRKNRFFLGGGGLYTLTSASVA